MTKSFTQSAAMLLVAALGTACYVGCEKPTGNSPSANNPSTVTPTPHTPVTGEDVQREAGEALEATKEYLGQKNEEFSAEMSNRLADLDAKMADMSVEGEKLKGEAKEKWEASMAELKVKRAEMSVKLEELKKSSGAAWDELKVGLQKAGKEVDKAAEDAAKKFKSDPHDNVEQPANP